VSYRIIYNGSGKIRNAALRKKGEINVMKMLDSIPCIILSVLLLAIAACSKPIVIREFESKATLVVNSEPEGASVYVDGQTVGKTPCTVEMDAGVRGRRAVTVAVSKEGYATKQARMALVAGQQVKWTDICLDRTTTLVVDCEPEGASVYVDGQMVGKTPCTVEMDAGVRGRHKVIVAVSKEGYGTKRAEVQLVAGKKVEWTNIRLDKLTTHPSADRQFVLPLYPLASEEQGYVFSLFWPEEPGIGFDNPHGVASDSFGNIYVSTDHRVFKLSPDGNLLLSWGTFGSRDGQFNGPAGIAVDGSGFVYVADELNRIQKFAPDGTFLTKWGTEGSGDGQFRGSNGLALDGFGNVYVADCYNYRIQKFTSDGRFLAKWGARGYGDGQFDGAAGIAVDGRGNVYVADVENRHIQKFTSDGTFLTKWGTEGSEQGQFIYPQGVGVDDLGNVYVADVGSIKKFTSEGTFLAECGEHGSRLGQVDYPLGVAVDSWGNIYIADTENDRVQKLTPEGDFLIK